MKPTAKRLLYGLFVFLFLSKMLFHAAAQSALFPLSVGAVWTYEATDGNETWESEVKITGKENVNGAPCFVLEAARKGKEARGQTYITIGSKGAYVVKIKGENSMTGKFDDAIKSPIPLLQFPLKKGKKWEWSGSFKILVKEITFKTQSEVLGEEKIKVPAGTFDAFKVKTQRYFAGKLGGEETRWYAPGTGMVKSVNHSKKLFGFGKDRTVTQVLKKFKKD